MHMQKQFPFYHSVQHPVISAWLKALQSRRPNFMLYEPVSRSKGHTKLYSIYRGPRSAGTARTPADASGAAPLTMTEPESPLAEMAPDLQLKGRIAHSVETPKLS